ncbi:unnamed protein product [Alternaria burnsii]|nr:unnamed protein product [Alternaria burnsii]
MSYDGEPTSENPTATSVLTRATRYSPTIFPLLFASVVGRATHTVLLWRLEKGERINILDTLATSTSLTSTVTSQIHLRQISVLSVLLVFIWTLSPIGGQASLRQMSIERVAKHSDAILQYVVPLKELNVLSWDMGSNANNLFITGLFASSSTKPSPVDLWGNIKIPKIEHYENTAEPDSNGWFETRPGDDSLGTYSSPVGIPINGTQSNTTTTDYDFRFQTEYLELACNYFDDERNINLPYGNIPSDAQNVTGRDGLIWWRDINYTEHSGKVPESLQPFNFTYAEIDPSYSMDPNFDGDVRSTFCSVENTYVEVEVLCAVNSTCRAAKVRRSQLRKLPSWFTLMHTMDTFEVRSFMKGFMMSIGGEINATSSSVLYNYLEDPSLRFVPDNTLSVQHAAQISDRIFSERIGQLLNSYWTCLYGTYTMIDGIRNETSYFWDTDITFEPPKNDPYDPVYYYKIYNWTSDGFKSKVWTSQGNKYEHIDVMIAHTPWAITLAIASLVLVAFSLILPIVRHFFTAGPDIAMNFSSLATRNNTHVPIPAGGSFLPASDRFRLLKDLRLRFADAEGKSDVGNLVIAAQGVEKAGYSRVRKGRLYE